MEKQKQIEKKREKDRGRNIEGTKERKIGESKRKRECE